MKKFFIIFSIAIIAASTVSAQQQDPTWVTKWMYANASIIKDGLPDSLVIGDTYSTPGFLATCPVSRDEYGTIVYPTKLVTTVTVYVVKNGKPWPITARLVDGPHDAQIWENICVKNQVGKLIPNKDGYDMYYSVPMRVEVRAKINGRNRDEYTVQLPY